MTANESKPRPLRVSERCYERLLVLYPRRHRVEFGAAMTQLFRDQCRDAWLEARGSGLLLLWLRILPDLLKTSIIEHLANLKGKKFMSKNIFANPRPSSPPRIAFLIVFALTFGLVLFTATIVTFILPEAYRSQAVVKIDSISPSGATYDPYLLQTENEIIKSEIILDRVIDRLDLNERWQKKYGAETKFKTSESRMALKRMIEVRPERNTMLMDIAVFSDDRYEAAQIANTIADTYVDYHKMAGQIRIERIEGAVPALRPARPNKPLNIFIGLVLGVIAGCFFGGIVALFISRMQKGRKSPPPLPQPSGAA